MMTRSNLPIHNIFSLLARKEVLLKEICGNDYAVHYGKLAHNAEFVQIEKDLREIQEWRDRLCPNKLPGCNCISPEDYHRTHLEYLRSIGKHDIVESYGNSTIFEDSEDSEDFEDAEDDDDNDDNDNNDDNDDNDDDAKYFEATEDFEATETTEDFEATETTEDFEDCEDFEDFRDAEDSGDSEDYEYFECVQTDTTINPNISGHSWCYHEYN